jgi:hypothetical protein
MNETPRRFSKHSKSLFSDSLIRCRGRDNEIHADPRSAYPWPKRETESGIDAFNWGNFFRI